MLKRWAVWPRGIRWLADMIAAVVLALAIAAIAWVLFVLVANWLTTHDVGDVTEPQRTLRLRRYRVAAASDRGQVVRNQQLEVFSTRPIKSSR